MGRKGTFAPTPRAWGRADLWAFDEDQDRFVTSRMMPSDAHYPSRLSDSPKRWWVHG